jgi:pullulanase
VDYSKVNYSKAPYAKQPYQTITYAECHDNHVLWDKLAISAKDAAKEERINMHKLALSIVLTSQGISFLHAGTEFLRSKKGVENSYESSDSINAIDWGLKSKNKEVFEFVKALIKIRKEHAAFRMTNTMDIERNISFLDSLPEGVISYTINGKQAGDSWNKIQVYFNGTGNRQNVTLSSSHWKAIVFNNSYQEKNNEVHSNIDLKPFSCTILYH